MVFGQKLRFSNMLLKYKSFAKHQNLSSYRKVAFKCLTVYLTF